MKKHVKQLWALVLCGAMALSVAGCNTTKPKESTPPSPSESAGGVKAGTYTAAAKGYGDGEVTVEVTVDEAGKMTDIQVNALSQTDSIGQLKAPDMAKAILDAQSLEVDTISGATLTCDAIVVAVEDALEQAGVDTAALRGEAGPAADDEEVTVDVVVVGAGASGTGAAAAALDAGASVLMVEKTGDVGGISKLWAGGPFAIESHLQKEAGGIHAELTADDLFQTLNDYAHYINYGPLTKAVIYGSADTIEFLEDWGVTFHINESTPQVSHMDDPLKWANYHWYDTFSYSAQPGDLAAIDIVHQNMVKKGLDIRFKTTATELIQDADGTVKGIVATREDGSKLTVHAKQVILGTGGFAGNAEMMQEYYRTPNIGMWGEMGTGVQMAWKAGAAKWDTASSLFHGNGMLNPATPGEVSLGYSPFNRVLKSPLLWVDQSGNRFCNEEAVWDTALATNVAYGVGGKFYILVDAATLQVFTDGKNTPLMDTAVGGPNMDPGDFLALAEEGVKQGNVWKGDSLEALAETLGMKSDRLLANVNEYNEAVTAKHDPYGKGADSLVYGVSEGPFYAIGMQMGNLGTLGGVRVNEELQACDVNLKPIPGLYVVGNDAAGFYGNNVCYPPYEGLATGFAWNSGKLAGRSAAAQLAGK